eukprot:TRINITY_DN15550_c0_g1_i1.p1 TRINITY_DN15550_c0_g1~~TRINITY_DN15550_c0_g1_i1.p1  ORF type:complete len:519 (-),score=126.66 TRINITY_DN15550_c0_g1_i1:13-1515(-)
MAAVIGIRFGYTTCCVAVMKDAGPDVIAAAGGDRLIPACVAFTDTDVLIGAEADAQAFREPSRTIYGVKKVLGKKWDDADVVEYVSQSAVKVVEASGLPVFEINRKTYSPEVVASYLFRRLKETAEQATGPVSQCVVAVPRSFTAEQRAALGKAAELAGLKIVRFLHEAAAATLAYDQSTEGTAVKASRNVLVFSMGGSRVEATLLQDVQGALTTKGESSDNGMGGATIDNLLLDHFIKEFEAKSKMKITDRSSKAIRRLARECEYAKCQLSRATTVSVHVDALYEGVDFSATLTRPKFESLLGFSLDRCTGPVQDVLEDLELDPSTIDAFLLIGGSTRIPKLQRALEDLLERAPATTIEPDTAIACGCAIQGGLLRGKTDIEQEATTEVMIAPHSIGIATHDGGMRVLIAKGEVLPAKATVQCGLSAADQTSVHIRVFEGEAATVAENKLLAQCVVNGLKGKVGAACVAVSFELTEEGKLAVSAKSLATNQSVDVVVSK